MKEQLIKLTNELDFYTEVGYCTNSKYYLWLCELQKWLREKHNIIISVMFELNTYEIYIDNGYDVGSFGLNKVWKTYEEALEAGLFEALKLIK